MKKLLMSFVLLPILLLALPAGSQNQFEPRGMYPRPTLEDKKYYECTLDKHCTTAELPCGRIVVLNTRYRQEVQGWADFVAPKFQCLATTPREKAENITCEKNMCRADMVRLSRIMEDTPVNRNPAYCETIDDCAVVIGPCNKKIIVNKSLRKPMQKEYDKARDMRMEQCFLPDNRTVERLHCRKNTCEADLKVPDQTYWNKPVDMRNRKKPE